MNLAAIHRVTVIPVKIIKLEEQIYLNS